MVFSTHWLVVLFIPKQIVITTMRDNMIYNRGRYQPLTLDTPWMISKKHQPITPPPLIIPTPPCALALLILAVTPCPVVVCCLLGVLLTVPGKRLLAASRPKTFMRGLFTWHCQSQHGSSYDTSNSTMSNAPYAFSLDCSSPCYRFRAASTNTLCTCKPFIKVLLRLFQYRLKFPQDCSQCDNGHAIHP